MSALLSGELRDTADLRSLVIALDAFVSLEESRRMGHVSIVGGLGLVEEYLAIGSKSTGYTTTNLLLAIVRTTHQTSHVFLIHFLQSYLGTCRSL